MAVTSQQIIDFLTANPGMTDAQIVAAMEQYGISPTQMAEAVGIPEGQIAARVAETVPPGQSITLGDTIVQPVHATTGSGEDQQVGGIENVLTYKVGENKVGGDIKYYSPTGEYQQTTQQQKVDTSLGGAIKDIASNPLVRAGLLAYGVNALGGLEGILGGGAGTAGAVGSDLAGLSGIPAGTGALTAAESAALYGTGGAATAGAAGGAAPLATTPTVAGTGIKVGAGLAGTGVLTGSTLGTSAAAGGTTSLLTPAATVAGTGLLTSAVKALAPTAGSLVSSGLTTAGGLLQSQTSKEAAQKAQARIDAETAAAKASAAFTPVGMTTRFGTSQFQVDPTTGKLTSAGYTLSPEAKAAQDRFVKLAESGLQQAEGAQQAFAPLQQGAQSLFSLGNQYLAKSPEQVAQDYMNKQLALLQPGRDLELANLQNKLQQQGRAGLSVAQGGTMGATTPELQALFNARAQQEALLAANAQQAGQQNVMFGAGLLGTGAQTMGQFYGGQQQAYSPYTTAMGQIQALEAAGQQPFTMGVNLGQIGSQAGANVGKLGLTGAGQSVELATGQAATNNPYATVMSGLGSSGLLTSGVNNLINTLGMSESMAPTIPRATGPLDVNTSQLGSALGLKLPSNFLGTTQTLLPTTVGYSF